MDNMKKQAVLYGHVATLLKRRRATPEVHSSNPGIRAAAERAAINMPIQGTAADIIKVAMICLYDELGERHPEAHMILQVHYELVFDVPSQEIEELGRLVSTTMENALTLSVPIEVEMKIGRDWYDMTPLQRAV